MGRGPHRRNYQRSAFIREILHPLWRLERSLQDRRSRTINKYARFVDGQIQTCPTPHHRVKPKIIFNTEDDALNAQREFARIGSDEAHAYPCTVGDNHWHLGRDRK